MTLSVENKEIWTSELLKRPCPLCGSRDNVIISRRMKDNINLPTVICRECSLVFTNPLPKEEIYNRFYEEAYNDFYIHQEKFTPSNKIPGDVRQIIDIISKFLPDNNSRILEIGSGSGRLIYYLSDKYPNIKGIEPGSNSANAKATYRLNIIDDFFESHDFGDEKFNLILMVHVFEHFYDVNQALLKCRDLLTGNGYLFIEVPNILKPFKSPDHYFLRYVHPINYSPYTIKSLLLKHGFLTVYEDSEGNRGLGPKNIRVVAVKDNSEKLSSQTEKISYKDVIKEFKLKRLEWILYGRTYFNLVKSFRLIKSKLVRSVIGDIIKKIVRHKRDIYF